MFQIMCMSIAESPKGRDGPRITTYRAHHVNLAAQTRSENFIRLYLRQNHLPTGSSLLIGKPKTSAFRSCHPQRLKQRTLKVTVQRLALKLPKKITFFAEETTCQKNYICKELKSFGTSLVLNTLRHPPGPHELGLSMELGTVKVRVWPGKKYFLLRGSNLLGGLCSFDSLILRPSVLSKFGIGDKKGQCAKARAH